MIVLEARDVHCTFRRRRRGREEAVHALRGVDVALSAGETLALVGESGGGKTTLARVLLGLLGPTRGDAEFSGAAPPIALPPPPGRAVALRARMQLVSQDPQAALDPSMTVGDAIEEGYRVQRPGLSRRRRQELVSHLLEELGLAAGHRERRPGALSGGEKRRVVIARALAALGYGCPAPAGPRVLVADEPTAGLDAVVRSQVLRCLETQRQTMGLACLLISHDLDAVAQLADRVAIVHAGQLVEVGATGPVLAAPRHPYTRQLVAASRLDGPFEAPVDASDPAPTGCAFRLACDHPERGARCADEPPLPVDSVQPARCWFARPLAGGSGPSQVASVAAPKT